MHYKSDTILQRRVVLSNYIIDYIIYGNKPTNNTIVDVAQGACWIYVNDMTLCLFSVSRNSTTDKRTDRQNASNKPDEDDREIYDDIEEPNQQLGGVYNDIDDATMRSGNREGGNAQPHGLELTRLPGDNAVGGYTGLATTKRDNQGSIYRGLTPTHVDNEGGDNSTGLTTRHGHNYSGLSPLPGDNGSSDYIEPISTQGENGGGTYLELTAAQHDNGGGDYVEPTRAQGGNESHNYIEVV